MNNEREMKKAKELKNIVKKEIIKRKRFKMIFNPIIIFSHLFIPFYTLACFIDAFIPYMPDTAVYIGLVITCIGVFLAYEETMLDVKVNDAKSRYRRYISKLNMN